jgi:hypothetical protein
MPIETFITRWFNTHPIDATLAACDVALGEVGELISAARTALRFTA